MKTFKNTVPAYCGIMAVLLLGFAVLIGCTGEREGNDPEKRVNNIDPGETTEKEQPGSYPGVDAKTEKQIKQAYLDSDLNERPGAVIDDILFEPHTVVNGCVVVRIKDISLGETGIPYTFFINSVPFTMNSRPIIVWKDGRLYELREAYDLGFLIKEGEEGQPGTYPGVDAKTERQIKQAYLNSYLNERPEAGINDILFEPYTVVNDCIVVRIRDIFMGEMGIEAYYYVINGVPFNNNGRPLIVWKNGRLYELQEACDLGFVVNERGT